MNTYYADMFNALFPGFFDQDYIRAMPPEDVPVEQILDLHTFDPGAVTIPCPEHITFGWYKGDMAPLHEAVALVDEDWVQYFNPGNRIYCAFDGDRVVSFCQVDAFGIFDGKRIGGPGCVGTIPAYRARGIGLKMVQQATAILKEDGFDISYIHYTGVGHWYARLGYETVVRWNCTGILE